MAILMRAELQAVIEQMLVLQADARARLRHARKLQVVA